MVAPLTASYAGDSANQASTASTTLTIGNPGPYVWQYGYNADHNVTGWS